MSKLRQRAFRRAPFCAAMCAGFLCIGAASAQTAAVAAADRMFMTKAAVGGLAEVTLGNLAQQKASSDQVKQFGAQMVQDHSKANDELKQIASTKNVELPTALDKKHQAVVDRMQKLSGAAFDKAYMADMVSDHKEDIADFSKESKGGKDGDVKAFADKTLPTLQQHLQMAQATNSAVKNAK